MFPRDEDVRTRSLIEAAYSVFGPGSPAKMSSARRTARTSSKASSNASMPLSFRMNPHVPTRKTPSCSVDSATGRIVHPLAGHWTPVGSP